MRSPIHHGIPNPAGSVPKKLEGRVAQRVHQRIEVVERDAGGGGGVCADCSLVSTWRVASRTIMKSLNRLEGVGEALEGRRRSDPLT